MFGRLADSNAMAQILYGLALRLVLEILLLEAVHERKQTFLKPFFFLSSGC